MNAKFHIIVNQVVYFIQNHKGQPHGGTTGQGDDHSEYASSSGEHEISW